MPRAEKRYVETVGKEDPMQGAAARLASGGMHMIQSMQAPGGVHGCLREGTRYRGAARSHARKVHGVQAEN